MNDSFSINISSNTSLFHVEETTLILYTRVEVAVLSLVFLIAFVGNLLVILKLIFFRYKNPIFNTKSQNRMSFFIVNLCIADLCVAFTSTLPEIIWRYNKVFWSSSDLICRLITFLQVLPIYSSTLILILMCYDRFKHLNKVHAKFFWSFKKSLKSILVAWGLSVIISLPQIFIFKMKDTKFGSETVRTCFAEWSPAYLEIIYIFYHTILQYILPLILMIYFFTRIYFNVRKSRANPSKQQVELFLMKSKSELSRRNSRFRRSYSESRIKTFKLTFTIVLTFFLCGLPFYSATIVNVLFRDQIKSYQDKLYGLNIRCALISYVLFPQSRNKKHHANGYPRALINCKNECFINVILQSLAASKKVTYWLLSNKSDSMSSKSLYDTLTSIIIGINRLENVSGSSSASSNETDSRKQLINFEQDQDEFYAAQSFKAALNAHNWVIQSEEHDCHELFHLIMDVLDEEQLENKKSLSSLNYFTPSHLKDNSRVKARNPFHGHLVSQLQCLDCNYKYPLRLESFYSLSLILPPQKPSLFGGSINGVTLIECINNYFKTEHITGMKCENCPKLEHNNLSEKNRKGFIKKQAIAKLPDTLAIHIQRNSWSDQNLEMIKQTNYVQFPLSIKIDSPNQQPKELTKSSSNGHNLNILKTRLDSSFNNSTFSLKQVGIGGLLGGNKHLSSPLSHLKKMVAHQHHAYQSYELRSAVVHFGNATSGHFVCFRQPLDKFFLSSDSTGDISTNIESNNVSNNANYLRQNTENWLQISDSDIKLCKKYHLLSNNVYMLFYDKVASVTSQLNE